MFVRFINGCLRQLIVPWEMRVIKICKFETQLGIDIFNKVNITLEWMPGDLVDVVSQYWFRRLLGAVRQQAITWDDVDQDLCYHMALSGHNELITREV